MKFRKALLAILIAAVAVATVAQESSSKFHPGTVLKVVKHQPTSDKPANTPEKYDVTVQQGDMVYVVLVTPLPGRHIEYSAGLQVMMSVGEKTIKFNDLQGQTKEVPIVSSRKATTKLQD